MADPQPKRPQESEARSSTIVMPEETNNHGRLFGGALVSHIDRLAAMSAVKHCRSNVVTASIDQLDFLAPVEAGHFIHLHARVSYTGSRSMELLVDVQAEHPHTAARHTICEAMLTFVALDQDGRPTPVPHLLLETDEDRALFAAGKARYEARKAARAK